MGKEKKLANSGQILKRVFIQGEDYGGAFKDAPFIKDHMGHGFFNKKENLLLGYQDKSPTLKDIYSALKGRLDENSIVFFKVHGEVESGRHRVRLSSFIATRDVFKQLGRCSKMRPITVILSSCYGGAAHQALDELPKGSALTTYGREDEAQFSITAQHVLDETERQVEQGLIEHLDPLTQFLKWYAPTHQSAQQVFLDQMQNCAAIATFGISNGKLEF